VLWLKVANVETLEEEILNTDEGTEICIMYNRKRDGGFNDGIPCSLRKERPCCATLQLCPTLRYLTIAHSCSVYKDRCPYSFMQEGFW
jgi:hypothetical protein